VLPRAGCTWPYNPRVRVGISLLTLVPGVSGGSETYVRELVRALGRGGEHEYRVFLPSIAQDVDGLPAEVVSEYAASRSTPGRLAAMARGTLRGGPITRRFAGLDLLHFPLSVMIPRVSSPAAISTVLDVQHEELPEFFSRAERAYRKAVYGWTVRRSSIVITISQHAAGTLVERLGIPADRVRPIHLGIDHDRFHPGDEPREPFLLYPARPWPHKNHARLLESFALLRRERPELRLVLTGGGTEALPAVDGVDARGSVTQEELVSLYRRAACVVFPSLYEGFGQPPLEAMACGTPVACSDAASLPEVCGGAARLFDPRSAEAIADAVDEVLRDHGRYERLGLARAASFTWEATARAHDAVYREAAS
jgi:glycosyltransferase involved in cell wall biosynthesis